MSINPAVAQRFEEIADMLDLLGEDRFRINAHRKAARVVEGLTVDLASLDRRELLEIDGVGPKIADKILEFARTGRMTEHDELAARVPHGLRQLLSLQGLGPKTVALLWKERGIVDLPTLKSAIDAGSLVDVPRMGAKTIENLRAAIALLEESGKRLPLGIAHPLAHRIARTLRSLPGVTHAEPAGSLRRGRDTIGDIDILACTSDPEALADAFTRLPGVTRVLASGASKSSVRMRLDARPDEPADAAEAPLPIDAPDDAGRTVQVDLRIVPIESWGAALMYFTGSKEHNVRLRERSLRRGYTLNEYGLFPLDDDPEPPQKRGVRPAAGRSEVEVYEKLGLPFIPPEIREDRGELDVDDTPRLIEVGDIRAELHAHTTASDGTLSIDALIDQARTRRFHTIAVTDHSKSAIQANGLSVDRLREHVRAVREAGNRSAGITVLAGSEVDILADGRLDYDDDTLSQLDVVVASPHTALAQEPGVATRRLVRAIENPFVRILGHPTGRLIDRRPGLSPDLNEIIAAAVEHGVALEINAHWMRLDLRDTHVHAAAAAGALIAINCDVHVREDFDNLLFGVLTGRRGWLPPEQCVNTWPETRLRRWLRDRTTEARPGARRATTPTAAAAPAEPTSTAGVSKPRPKKASKARGESSKADAGPGAEAGGPGGAGRSRSKKK